MDRISSLPDEILLAILAHLPLDDLLRFTQTCRRMQALMADASTWRQRCAADFAFWDEERHQDDYYSYYNSSSSAGRKTKIRHTSSLEAVDWRAVYVARHRDGVKAQATLDSVLASQYGRLRKVDSIAGLGYDLGDVLTTNINVPDNDPRADGLARRWYARAILGRVQRSRAVRTWSRLAAEKEKGEEEEEEEEKGEGEVSIVEALLGYDKFILSDKALEFKEAQRIIKSMATSVVSSCENWRDLSTRERALKIVAYLREKELVGLRPHHEYVDIRNSLLTVSLTHPEHPSLPLISAVIYCAVASELDIDARPCAFPMHVYTIVYAKDGCDLDDKPLAFQRDDDAKRIFLDPFSSDQPKPIEEILEVLPRIGIHLSEGPALLRPVEKAELISRCGRNITNAAKGAVMEIYTTEEIEVERETVLYASLWSFMIFSEGRSDENLYELSMRRRTYLPHLVKVFETQHPLDASLVEECVCPLFDVTSQRGLLRAHLQDIFHREARIPDVKERNTAESKKVKYRIGQIFRHRRYHYEGVIYGWDVHCVMPEDWIRTMGVANLERGRQQPFYNVLAYDAGSVHDASTPRYVAEDNIDVLTPSEPPLSILKGAGKYFKRWDVETSSFISNIRDEYPDD